VRPTPSTLRSARYIPTPRKVLVPDAETDLQVAALVRASADGDSQAWEALVDRFAGLVWAVARGHRLSDADAADVSQTTWLRLVENLHRLQDPARVGAWLATTARRECLRVIRMTQREPPTEDVGVSEAPALAPQPDTIVVDAEQRALLWAGLEQVSERCQRLLRILMASPPPSYLEVSAALELPIGSIGPTRQRCLAQLRARLAEIGLTSGGEGR
jgi:RNA polymerase sigma factor (sigma-70 family)